MDQEDIEIASPRMVEYQFDVQIDDGSAGADAPQGERPLADVAQGIRDAHGDVEDSLLGRRGPSLKSSAQNSRKVILGRREQFKAFARYRVNGEGPQRFTDR